MCNYVPPKSESFSGGAEVPVARMVGAYALDDGVFDVLGRGFVALPLSGDPLYRSPTS
jgi:hypothetical protein